MAIPISPKMRELVAIYRKAWRDADHPGDGEVMMAFHMFCHEDGAKAREIAREPFDAYFRMLAEVTGEFETTTRSTDYRDYDKMASKLRASTLESQIASGGALIGAPQEMREMILRANETFGPFDHASLQINFATLPMDEAMRSLNLFADKVMPFV